MSLISLLCVTCVLMTSSVSGRRGRHLANTEDRHMTGVAGKEIVLRCDLLVSSPPSVRWIDYVYNTNRDPEVIFAHGRVQRSHPNADNFRVDSDFGLTISSLRVDTSPGQYECHSVVDGRTHQLVYQLTVCNMPRCSGVTHVNAGDSTSLVCESTYSGNEQPQLDWYRQGHRRHRLTDNDDLPRAADTRHGQRVDSSDEFDIRETGPVARQVVRLATHHHDDAAVYTCRMTLVGMVQQCNLTLNVTYLVKDVRFRPADSHVAVGDEIRCHARGNPAPRISIKPPMTSEVEGTGWKSFRVPELYEGRDLNVVCTATNAIDDVWETVSKNRTFHVAARSPDEHGHVKPNEHPPEHGSSSSGDNTDTGQAQVSNDSKNSGEARFRVEQNFAVVASLLSLVMLR